MFKFSYFNTVILLVVRLISMCALCCSWYVCIDLYPLLFLEPRSLMLLIILGEHLNQQDSVSTKNPELPP